MEICKPTEKTYWIAYSSDKDILNWGITEPDQVTTSGMENFESGITYVEMMKRLNEIGFKILDIETEEEVLPITTISQVLSTTKSISIVKGIEVVEKKTEVVYEEEKTSYLTKSGIELNIYDNNCKVIPIPVAEEGIISKAITKVVDGIVWVYDGIIGWFKS